MPQEETPTPSQFARVGARPRTLWLLLNKKALADEVLRATVDEVRARGHAVEVCPIWEPTQAVRLARLAADSGADVVVAAGGDGTVNETLNGLHASGRGEVALGILPYGTANDFARATGLFEGTLRERLLFMAEAQPVPLDVGSVNDRLFLNVASGGISAEATTETPRLYKEMLGAFAYSLVGFQKLFHDIEHTAEIRTPQWQWQGQMLFFVVANGRYAGGGYQAAPKALLNDGLLDLGLVPDVPPDEFPQMLAELFILADVESDYVQYLQVPWVELTCPEGMQVNADGEPLYGHEFRFELLKERRPVFVRREAAPLKESDRRRGG